MRCPITYEEIVSTEENLSPYSLKGLHCLDKKLHKLKEFSYTQKDQLNEINKKENKISLSGQQPKLLIHLNVKAQEFEIAKQGGQYILKPQNNRYSQLPENEDVTMKLAACVDIEVPVHGLLYCKGKSFAYFIRRFDRRGSHKLAVEDFAQLEGQSREEKYESSMEKAAKAVDRCTFPVIERQELLKRVLFCYLTGNEDMHLKNFSLLTTSEGIVKLSPAYDLLNTTIAANSNEEMALPLNGKKKYLTKKDLIEYYGIERLKLTDKVVQNILSHFSKKQNQWKDLINYSFLSDDLKKDYINLIKERSKKLGIE